MAWNISPTVEEIRFLMESGVVLRDAHRFAQAEEVFRGVRALAPASEIPETALGTLQFEQGKFPEAIKHYRRALEINERSAFAQAHLGESLLFNKDKDGARTHLRRAVELDPRGEAGRMARSLLDLVDAVSFS